MGLGSVKSHSTSVSTLPRTPSTRTCTLFTPSSHTRFGVQGFNGLLISHRVGWQSVYICVSINAAENGYIWNGILAYYLLHIAKYISYAAVISYEIMWKPCATINVSNSSTIF